MQLEQTLGMYQPMQMQRTQQRERVYTIVDLESLSASALYTGDSGSGFGESFGLGIGYVFDTLNVDGKDIQMRLRADEGHKGYESPHLNLEYYEKGKIKPFLNDHLDVDWKD